MDRADISVTRNQIEVAVNGGRVKDGRAEGRQFLFAEVILQRQQEGRVLRHEAGVVPSHIIIGRAGGEVDLQLLVDGESIKQGDDLDGGAGRLFKNGNGIVHHFILTAADIGHSYG